MTIAVNKVMCDVLPLRKPTEVHNIIDNKGIKVLYLN